MGRNVHELCLMQVTVFDVKKGHRVHRDDPIMEAFSLGGKEADEFVEEIAKVEMPAESRKQLVFEEDDLAFTEDVQLVAGGADYGISYNSPLYQSLLGYEVEAVGMSEILNEYIPDLIELAKPILGKWDRDNTNREVSFLTVWSYTGTYDYFGEYDAYTELCGRLDMSKLASITIEPPKPPKPEPDPVSPF